MKLSTIIKLRKELESIKESGLTISEYCTKIGKARSGYSIRIKKVIESEGEYKEEAEKVISLYNELSGKRKPKSKFQEADLFSLDGSVSEKVIEENTEPDEFDGTTHVTYIRSLSTNKITGYEVQVKVRDKADFITTLSRSDAELIFGLYTYYGGNITARNVANEFPRYTLPEVKKIFRAFKLTKDSAWFPPHICEEYTEEEKAQYRMNLKERAAFKYADSRQERDFKNTINKMASEINRLKNFNGQFEEILTKFTGKNSTIIKHFPKVVSDGKTIMIFLADMHIGAKVNDQALFDNHYDMSVVYSRMDQIIAYFSKFSPCKRIVVVNVGDALFWLTLVPITAGLTANMAMEGQIIGAVLFLIIFNAVQFAVRFGLMYWSYGLGTKAVTLLTSSAKEFTRAASILGIFVVGGLIANYGGTSLRIVVGDPAINIQGLLDGVLPKLIPLLITLGIYVLIKKGWTPVKCIILILVVGILGCAFGIWTGDSKAMDADGNTIPGGYTPLVEWYQLPEEPAE